MSSKKKVNQEQFYELKNELKEEIREVRQEIREYRREGRNYFIGYVIGLATLLVTTFGYTLVTNSRMDTKHNTQLSEIRDIRDKNNIILDELRDHKYNIKSLEKKLKTK